MASLGSEGPRERPAEQRRTREGREVGLDCGSDCLPRDCHLTPYEVVVRFIVAGGAIVVMFHAFHARDYAFAAVFGALALLYNPVAPVFSFSGDWQRALVVASAVPFFASLAWRDARPAHND